MSEERNKGEKSNLHIRNRNRERYDLTAMTTASPNLAKYIQKNKVGADSINFSDPNAVKAINTAILAYYYGITHWDFPNQNLCPPIPGRAEYIHHIADLLSKSNQDKIPTGNSVTCLDIGMGASCIYPIIGVTEYDWNFIASDIDSDSISSAQNIIDSNPSLKGKVSCRLQENPKFIFKDIIKKEEKIAVVICNPPFHASLAEATKGSRRKIKNLTGRKEKLPKLNFSGNPNELVYEGGEFQFISRMITESKALGKRCLWFSCLVSKESNLIKIEHLLQASKPLETITIPMATGNKTSRLIAWSYFSPEERELWYGNSEHKANAPNY